MISGLKNKYIVKYSLKTLEPLAIGGSQELIRISEADRKIIKQVNGQPLIPGSSIKGVMRCFFDRVSKTLSEKYNVSKGLDLKHKNNKQNKLICNLGDRKKDIANVCDLCRFFGAMGYGAAIKFLDAYPDTPIDLLEERMHVKIDRDTDIAVKGGLFSDESVPKDTLFNGLIIFEERIFENDTRMQNQLLLFKLLLNQFHNNRFYLGGLNSRGYGYCESKINEIKRFTVEDLFLNTPVDKINPEDIDSFLTIKN